MPPVDIQKDKEGKITGNTVILPNPQEKKIEELKLPKPQGCKPVRDTEGKLTGDTVIDNSPGPESSTSRLSDDTKKLLLTVGIGVAVGVTAWYFAPMALGLLAL